MDTFEFTFTFNFICYTTLSNIRSLYLAQASTNNFGCFHKWLQQIYFLFKLKIFQIGSKKFFHTKKTLFTSFFFGGGGAVFVGPEILTLFEDTIFGLSMISKKCFVEGLNSMSPFIMIRLRQNLDLRNF